MFAVSFEDLALSPHCMRFKHLWIYDLRVFHEFWQNKIQEQNVFTAASPWAAVMAAYGLSLFSPLEELQNFARDYHSFFKSKNIKKSQISEQSIEKIFRHFRRLGVQKIGNLRKIPLEQIQKRFGKSWRVFFEGILNFETADWPWQPHKKTEMIEARIEQDYAFTELVDINEHCFQQLSSWAKELHPLFIEKLVIDLATFDSDEDQKIELFFSNRPEIKSQLNWIKRVLEDRFQQIELSAPVSCFYIQLQPSRIKRSVQLSLFDNQAEVLEWKSCCEKLEALDFRIFQPENTFSYAPEVAWKMGSPYQMRVALPVISNRPLIQFQPREIPEPQGQMHFTERMQWFDDQGQEHQRDYYMIRTFRQWKWIYRDQDQRFFEQGIIE